MDSNVGKLLTLNPKPGDVVPADLRLLSTSDLKVDEKAG